MELNGSNYTALISQGLTSMGGLTIDYDSNILYWVENSRRSSCIIKSYDLHTYVTGNVSGEIIDCQSGSIDFAVVCLLISMSILLDACRGG